MPTSSNRLLASLPADIVSAITPHLKTVELKFGDVLAEAGGTVRRIYFPYSGAIHLRTQSPISPHQRAQLSRLRWPATLSKTPTMVIT